MPDGSEYLAGLIHDIGWLFLATHFADEFALIITSEKPVIEAEKDVLPFSHANIAAAIAARSAMPLKAVDGIAYHHKQMLMTQSTLVAPNQNPLFLGIILAVCDRIADGCQLDLFGKTAPSPEELAGEPRDRLAQELRQEARPRDPRAEELVKSEEIFTAFFSEPAKV